MKTITKQFTLFTFDELSQEAKDKARNKWLDSNDYPFLQADLREEIYQLLKEKGYTSIQITPLYDLSNAQGSGLMFEGTVKGKNGTIYTIKQSGQYYHEYSKEIEAVSKNGNNVSTDNFNREVYIPICKAVRDLGYTEIERQQSEEYFNEHCSVNEYIFLKDGTLFNE